jgi:hypothetical protein
VGEHHGDDRRQPPQGPIFASDSAPDPNHVFEEPQTHERLDRRLVLEKQPDEVVFAVDRRHPIKNIAESVGQLRIDEVSTFDPQLGKAQLDLELGRHHSPQLVSGDAGVLEGNTKQLVVRIDPRRNRAELG